jgi:hypothetical protein
MKKFGMALIAAIILLYAGAALADQFGPPEPAAKPGKPVFGIGYFFAKEKLVPSNSDFLGVSDFWQNTTFSQNQAYLQGGVAVSDTWEVFARVGVADLRAKDVFNFGAGTDDMKDYYNLYGTLGFKGVLYSAPGFTLGPFSTFGLGPVVKGSYFADYQDRRSGNISGSDVGMTYKVKQMWDINLALSMQTKLSSITLFGGPFVYWKNVRSDLTVDISGTGSFSDSTKYESDNKLGGFIGLRIPFKNNLTFELEGQYTNRMAGGASILYSF